MHKFLYPTSELFRPARKKTGALNQKERPYTISKLLATPLSSNETVTHKYDS